MPVGQAVAANKPTPPTSSSGGQMHMSTSQMSAAQPAMSGWDMVKMRTTAKMRAKAARNAHLKGKPAQAAAATTYVKSKGPDYFGTSPNYASSPMPRLTWIASGFSNGPVMGQIKNPTYDPLLPTSTTNPLTILGVVHVATSHVKGDPAVLPVYDPATGTFTDPSNFDAPVTLAQTPYLADATGLAPLLDPINQIPQLDYTKVSIAGGIRKFVEPLPGLAAPATGSTMKTYAANKAVPSAIDTAVAAATSYIPVAIPDTTTYPGSDYYEIGLKEYFQTFSPDLPPTKLRGYYQINTVDFNKVPLRDASGNTVPGRPFYLGPIISATANRPVRVKFVNQLPIGAGGDLFLPTDTSAMGAGTGPTLKAGSKTEYQTYTQNRAVIHLHGGLTPWISDGTPNQWITPAGENTAYPKGVSVRNVPDMPDPGPGAQTFFYTNRQSARLMWYHDHAYGLTRLNVYAGEVSAYVLNPNPLAQNTDRNAPNYDPASVAQNALEAKLPAPIPLVIQDKAFVPDDIPSGYFPNGQLTDQDPTWNRAKWGGPAAAGPNAVTNGALWFPHVYMPNQNPYDDSGANAMGRWDYGPWFWPIFGTSAGLVHGEVANPYYDNEPCTLQAGVPVIDPLTKACVPNPTYAPWEPPFIPGTPSTYTNTVPKTVADANGNSVSNPAYSTSDVSLAPEAFVDTPVINGVAYPYMNVKPQAYRFRILNGANDRYWNLQMYCSAADKPSTTGYYTVANANTNALPMWATGALNDRLPQNPAAGEVPMVPAVRTGGFPGDWPTDGRDGGVPDPASAAGGFLQIATEGGVLPNAVDVENQPVNYVYNRRDIIVLSISTHALLLGPAERADVVYDFSTAAANGCKNVILYNDSPTPVPAFDPRNDYYTNNPNQTDSGGTPTTLPGYGPNTRTLMQFRIDGTATTTFNAADVKATVPAVFAAVQHKPIVPNTAYKSAYTDAAGNVDPIGQRDVYSRIQSNNISINASQVGDVASVTLDKGTGLGYSPTATVTPVAPDKPTIAARLVPVLGPNGTIASVTIVNPGVGYTKAPTITIATPLPQQGTTVVTATATARVSGGSITRVVMTPTDHGSGYSAGAIVTIDPSPATGNSAQATATIDVNTGAISAITVTDVGNGYVAQPAVGITKALYVGGVDATATANLSNNATGGTLVNVGMDPKAIQELFEMDYGRMNATLGVELPFTNSLNQTTLPMGYTEPVTEFLKPTQAGTQIGTARDGTAIWKITHNGVDTHTIHFHLMDVQLVNRVGWDGAIRPPDANEMGWKDSVRMNPLEDAIVAMRPATPELPFKIGESIRSIDPTMPANHPMSAFDPTTGQVVTSFNAPQNMGWEYVWHCHLLGHEENDMMRPVDFAGSPEAPSAALAKGDSAAKSITIAWTNNANWQLTNFVVQRSTNANFSGAVQTLSNQTGTVGQGGRYINWQGANGTLAGAFTPTTFTDLTASPGTRYYYRVKAESANGYSQWADAQSKIGTATRPRYVAYVSY
jgi:FtsP/CotA-like multicopper oxidase with cupredoxin domain